MMAVNIDAYLPVFSEAGIRRGADLQDIDEAVLQDKMNIQDEFNREVILSCLEELRHDSSVSIMWLSCDCMRWWIFVF